MKVIKKERSPIETPEYPKPIICEECGAELEIDEADVHIGCYGLEYVTCPECVSETIVDAVNATRKMKPTYPTTFYNYGVGEYAYHLCDAEVQKYVNDILKHKDEMKVGSFVHTSTGDTRVIGLKSKDEFSIIVAKNYWEDSICEEDR